MTIDEIQHAVEGLSPEERKKLTAWMVSTYPALSVEKLMARAANLVEEGEWTPSAPTEENRPMGKAADHAREVAERIDSRR